MTPVEAFDYGSTQLQDAECFEVKEAALVLLSMSPNLTGCTKDESVEDSTETRYCADVKTTTVSGIRQPLLSVPSYDSFENEAQVHFVPISDKCSIPKKKLSAGRLKVAIDQTFYRSFPNRRDLQVLPKVVSVPKCFDADMSPIRYQPELIMDLASLSKHNQNSNSSSLVSCASSVDNFSVASHSEQSEVMSTDIERGYDNVAPRYYTGSISLGMKDDEESLSPLHCFMRRYCVEAFTATEDDVSNPRYGRSHGRNIEVCQVGIQCIHCKHVPYAARQERAVCFPSSLKNIYHSIETWQRRHSLVCQYIPAWTKRAMLELMSKSRSGAGGRRHYWEESAQQLGMIDTNHGIRFISPLGTSIPYLQQQNSCDISIDSIRAFVPPRKPVVSNADEHLVTEYLFKLLQQMQVCYFSEEDRIGGRSKVKDCPSGYPGLECKHCAGRAGFGRYFPVSIQALTSANSDRNIFNHIMKCRKCPDRIKQELDHHMKQDVLSKNRRGSRKLFFRRVWERIHGPSSLRTLQECDSGEDIPPSI